MINTHSDYQKIIAIIRNSIRDLENDGRKLKALISYNFKKATPISAEGSFSFELYNEYLDQYRKNRRDLKLYIALIKDLKYHQNILVSYKHNHAHENTNQAVDSLFTIKHITRRYDVL